MNRLSKPRIALYLAGIFLAGMITGSILTVIIGKHMLPNQERMAVRWTRELQTKLGLTPGQTQKIEPVIRRTLEDFRAVMADDVLASISNCNARIVPELTPDQVPKFRKIELEQQAFVRGMFCTQTNQPK
ncbi:MAG: hypothetical protein U1F98_04365 [Verrucomicrobiota bacterium]